jgi:dsDNA-specific endonuclease/ATPase MutS2
MVDPRLTAGASDVTPSDGGESWEAYKALVLRELERNEQAVEGLRDMITANQEALSDKLGAMREDLARLNVKAGLWGAFAGILTAVAAMFAKFAAG